VTAARTVLLPLVKLLHRGKLEGLDNLPASGAFMVVANHSGCLGTAELSCLVSLWAERFGDTRAIAGFAHPLGFRVWPVGFLLRSVGAVPSTYDAARAVLASGIPLLVFPGGDYEVTRPVWQANRVDFANRLGFLRIAAGAGVPIIPLGIRGSHFTAPPLVRSRLLAWAFVWPRLFGVKRYPITLLGALVAAALLQWGPDALAWRVLLAYAFMASPLALLPWIPWTVRLRFGAPIPPPTTDDDAELRSSYATVVDAVQRLVGPK